jgi:hypothetical protein
MTHLIIGEIPAIQGKQMRPAIMELRWSLLNPFMAWVLKRCPQKPALRNAGSPGSGLREEVHAPRGPMIPRRFDP